MVNTVGVPFETAPLPLFDPLCLPDRGDQTSTGIPFVGPLLVNLRWKQPADPAPGIHTKCMAPETSPEQIVRDRVTESDSESESQSHRVTQSESESESQSQSQSHRVTESESESQSQSQSQSHRERT
eukprot:358547-Chlamydomonas_euryale.AAC.3